MFHRTSSARPARPARPARSVRPVRPVRPARPARPAAGPFAWRRAALIFLLGPLLVWVVTGCGDDSGPPQPNRPPLIELIGDPIISEGDRAVATIGWQATDPDGSVELFRYAVDDTSDTAWIETRDTEVTLRFSATTIAGADTVFIGSSQLPHLRFFFNGFHTLYVVAVDDDRAESEVASVSFNAETYAPESQIIDPSPGGIISLGPGFPIAWSATDPDGDHEVAGYSWRLVSVENVLFLADDAIQELLLDDPDAGAPWSDVTTVTSMELALPDAPAEYVFAVRAVDRNGALEPHVRTYRQTGPTNVMLIRGTEEVRASGLAVTVQGHTVRYPTGSRPSFEVAAGTSVHVSWQPVDGQGTRTVSYAYGVDLDRLDEDNPAWSEERADLTEVVLQFVVPPDESSSEHAVYVRSRNQVGGVQIAALEIVALLPQERRGVLLIDDWGLDSRGRAYPDAGPHCTPESAGGTLPDDVIMNSGQPADACHDEQLRLAAVRALAAIGRSELTVDRYELLHPQSGEVILGDLVDEVTTDDGYKILTGPLRLAELLPYGLVIWNTTGSGRSALGSSTEEAGADVLRSYLAAGGALWLSGAGVYQGTLPTDRSPGFLPFGFLPGDLLYDQLHLESSFDGSTCVAGCMLASGNDARSRRLNGFEGAVPSELAVAEGFPQLRVSRPPYGGSEGRARGFSSAAMIEGFGDTMPRGLEILYTYQSNGLLEDGIESRLDGGATAFRSFGAAEGRFMVYGFPLFFFDESELDPLMEASLRWLLD